MERTALLSTFRKLSTEIAEKDFSQVNEDAKIAELGIDSLNVLEIVGAMEREFTIRIPDEQLVGIQTVKQLLDLVHNRMSQA